MKKTTIPLYEQETFIVKDRIPELDTKEFVGPFAKVHKFNGGMLEASSQLVIGDKIVAENILMKPNCACAISQSNKRYLETYSIYTDYVEPNQLLFRALGFSENESKVLVYVKSVSDIPVYAIVTGYNLEEGNLLMPRLPVSFALKNNAEIAYEDAVEVIADWLKANGMDINSLPKVIYISDEAKAYAREKVKEEHKQLELARLYECAVIILEDIAKLSVVAYMVLQKKYHESGFIIAKLQLSWGMDDDSCLVLCDEVGTADNTFIASRELYEKNGILESIINAPVLKYFESIGYDVNSDKPVPEIPEDVLDEISDTYVYLTEAICDDLACDIHM